MESSDMNNTDQSLHTEGTVADYFYIESHLLSTRSADCYNALDKSRNEAIALWMLRHPLAVNSAAVKRFLQRMRSISEMSPPITALAAYGVDAGGTAFAVFPALDGMAVLANIRDQAEAERRLIAALRYVERLHASGVICGDICGSSFWVDRAGEVRFIGVMGTFDTEAVATAMLPPAETMPFFAPELRSGAGIEPGSDVFALGVLGYFLLAGRFPFGEGPQLLMAQFDLAGVPAPSTLNPKAPAWSDEVLMRALDPDPARRYPSAGEMLKAISSSRQRGLDQDSKPVRTQTQPAGPRTSLELQHKKIDIGGPEEEQHAVPESRLRRQILLLIGASVALTIGFFAVVYPWLTNRERSSDLGSRDLLSSRITDLGSEELKQAVNVLSQPEGKSTLDEKAREIEKTVSSDDPLAHDILVRTALEAPSKELRQLAEKAIVDRARRLRLLRSAEQVRQWLRGGQRAESQAYEAVLRSLDTTLPIEARGKYLRQAYAVEPQLSLRLAVAVAIDADQLADYQPVISQLVGDRLKLDNAENRSAIALVLADEEMAMVFGEDVIQKRKEIPDGDLLWVLKALADRNDINMRSIASLAVERGVLTPLRGQFLQFLRDRGDLPPDVVQALLRASAGSLGVSDIGAFGRWYDVESERMLLAALADSTDADVLRDGFDMLAGKSLSIEPSRSLVAWVKKHYWDDRAEFSRAVGILANVELVEPAAIDEMFNSLDRFVRDSDLVDTLISSNNPLVVKAVLQRYNDLVTLTGLLHLLANPDKDIRISAVRALKDYNDIGALKVIIDHYEREKDLDVRQVYKDTFWMIRQRQD